MKASFSIPDSEGPQLGGDRVGPIAIRRRAGRAGMQNLAQPWSSRRANFFEPPRGKGPNADRPFRLERRYHGPQVLIALREQSRFFRGRQFVRRAIAAAALQECQRTVVQNEMLREKSPARMLAFRAAHHTFDLQPVAHRFDFPERHARLHHSKRPRVHAEEHHSFACRSEFFKVTSVGRPGVPQWIINVRHRLLKFQRVHAVAQFSRGL